MVHRKQWIYKGAVCLLAGLVVSLTVSKKLQGQNPILPTGQGVATLALSADRKINIDEQAAQNASSSQFIYFYQPLFMLKENPSPIPGYPKVVLTSYPSGGLTYLRFGLILANASAQNAAIQAASTTDVTYMTATQRPVIVMNPWPIEYLSASVKSNQGDHAPLGNQWASGPISNTNGYIEFDIGFNDADLTRFKIDALTGYIDFEYQYSYTNTQVAYASMSATFRSDAVNLINHALGSINSSASYLFQDDISQLTQTLQTSYASYIQASDVTLIPYLQTQVINQLFKSSQAQWGSSDQSLQDALSDYVKPLLEQDAQKTVTEDSTTNTQSQDLSVSLGIGSTFKIAPDLKNELQTKHGVTLTQDSSTQNYVPRSITIYQQTGAQVADVVDSAQQVFVSKGPSAVQSLDQVPISVSESNVTFGGPTTQSQFVGIAPGMAVCYLSDGAIPGGYIELNGSSKWPNWNWVPANARGNSVPDETTALIGGGDATNVGTVSAPGTITVNGSLKVSNTNGTSMGITNMNDPAAFVGPPVNITVPAINIPNPTQLSFADVGPAPGQTRAGSLTLQPTQIGDAAEGQMHGQADITMAPPYLHCRWIVKTLP